MHLFLIPTPVKLETHPVNIFKWGPLPAALANTFCNTFISIAYLLKIILCINNTYMRRRMQNKLHYYTPIMFVIGNRCPVWVIFIADYFYLLLLIRAENGMNVTNVLFSVHARLFSKMPVGTFFQN